jgi:hypothetical protein
MGVGFQKESEHHEALNDAKAFSCLLLDGTLMDAISQKNKQPTNQPANYKCYIVNERQA